MVYLNNIDFSILNYIYNTFSCNLLDMLMPLITSLGNKGIVWIGVAILMLTHHNYRKNGLILLAALAVGALCTNVVLKNLFARPRPCWIYPVELLIPMPTDYSFPSGHTTASFISAVIIGCTEKRLGIAAFILAFLISFSRLYLYVHFPSDVICGAIFGSLVGFIMYKYIYPLIEKHLSF